MGGDGVPRGADHPPRDAQCVGSILVSFLSVNPVYALGCDERGRSNTTGYQLPRDAVVFLPGMLLTKTSERQGRVIDQDEGGAGMEKMKKRGCFQTRALSLRENRRAKTATRNSPLPGQDHSSRRELFERLAEGQHPEALFITCSDSRINPNLITQTEPGELFIIRNAGNIVPP